MYRCDETVWYGTVSWILHRPTIVFFVSLVCETSAGVSAFKLTTGWAPVITSLWVVERPNDEVDERCLVCGIFLVTGSWHWSAGNSNDSAGGCGVAELNVVAGDSMLRDKSFRDDIRLWLRGGFLLASFIKLEREKQVSSDWSSSRIRLNHETQLMTSKVGQQYPLQYEKFCPKLLGVFCLRRKPTFWSKPIGSSWTETQTSCYILDRQIWRLVTAQQWALHVLKPTIW